MTALDGPGGWPAAPSAVVAVFIHSRPAHLRRTLMALKCCHGFDASRIVVFGDGPKVAQQENDVEQARAVARELLGDAASYRFASTNKGLARSIIDGVSSLSAEYGRVVVVEDDLIVSPSFLMYMNAALEKYATEERVFQVSGHAFNAPELVGGSQAHMLPMTTTWGWGTWERAWKQFDEASLGWEQLARDAPLRKRFNLDGAYDYATMLERQVRGKRDSWGIRWYWTVFRRNGLVLYPPASLVRNEGMDGSGSHGRGVFRRYTDMSVAASGEPVSFPPTELDHHAFEAVIREIAARNGGSLGRIVDVAKRWIGS